MLKAKHKRTALTVLVLAILVSFAGCCGVAQMEQAQKPKCADEVKTQVSKEALLVSLDCEFKKFDGVKSLWYKVTLKNISQADQRYKVQIFLDSGKGVGGLIPRTTKKGLVKPGAMASFSYPVKGQDTTPKQATLFIKTLTD